MFKPCDVEAAIASFEELELATAPRADFVGQFSRENIMQHMAIDVLKLVVEVDKPVGC